MSRHLKALGRVPMLREVRARAMVRGFLLAAALLSWSSVASTQSPGGERLSADPTGEARTVALARLATLQKRVASGSRVQSFLPSDQSLIESAALGDPFVLYVADETFYAAEWVTGRDLLGVLRAQVWFPVISGSRVLGVISAQMRDGDRWKWCGDAYADWLPGIVEISKSTVVPTGQRVSFLIEGGRFALLENGDTITSMLPLDDATWQFLGMAPGGLVLDPVKWLKAETVLPVIHTEVERMIESTDE